ANETVTELVNNNDGTYTYTSEDGTETIVDVPADIVNQFENIVNYGPVTVDGETYNTIEEYIEHLVELNESVTTLVNNNDGTYTYTNEAGDDVTIDVPADVVTHFDEIINEGNTEVIEQLIDVLGDTYVGGNVYYDINEAGEGEFTYIDESGTRQTSNFEEIVQANETVTELVNNNDGTYTYTSEDGTETIVDVPADIVNQFENIVNDGPVTVDGETYNTIEEYIEHLVELNESVTTLVNNNDGTYT